MIEYDSNGDKMKKYFITIIVSLLIGFLLSYYMIKEYDDAVLPTFMNSEAVYLIEQGAYLSYDDMIENTKEIENYIYNEEDSMFYVYVGMSLLRENALKIQNAYDFKTSLRRVDMSNDFVNELKQYDSIISETEDSDTIKEVCKQILSKYDGG